MLGIVVSETMREGEEESPTHLSALGSDYHCGHILPLSSKLSLRVKALKRQVDEAEEEIERLEVARKKALRELEEQHETNEQLQSRVKALEKDLW